MLDTLCLFGSRFQTKTTRCHDYYFWACRTNFGPRGRYRLLSWTRNNGLPTCCANNVGHPMTGTKRWIDPFKNKYSAAWFV